MNIKIVMSMVIVALVAACSGGGGGSSSSSSTTPSAISLTGVAAAGSPIVGSVAAKDSLGVTFGPATIGQRINVQISCCCVGRN